MENTGVFSILEFCEQAKFSEPMLYKLQRLGIGPRIVKVGRRTLILETAREYYARRAAETNPLQPADAID